jgi:hypothetical protein
MATFHVSFGRAGDSGIEVMPARPNASQAITTSGSSQASTITAKQGDQCRVTVTGGNVYIAFGASPTAVSTTGYLLLDGDKDYFGALNAGDKVAVIDA